MNSKSMGIFFFKNTLTTTKNFISIYIILAIMVYHFGISLVFTLTHTVEHKLSYFVENISTILLCVTYLLVMKITRKYYAAIREVFGLALYLLMTILLVEHIHNENDNSNIFLILYSSFSMIGNLAIYEIVPNFLRAFVYQIIIFLYFTSSTFMRRSGISILSHESEGEFYAIKLIITIGSTVFGMRMRQIGYTMGLTMEKTIKSWKKVMKLSCTGISIETESQILFRNTIVNKLLPTINNSLLSTKITDLQTLLAENTNLQIHSSTIYFNNLYATLYTVNDITEIRKEQQQKYIQLLIATITHELRTPLNIIMAILTFIKEKSQNAHINEEVQKAICASYLQEALINDILDVAKINNGKLKLIEAPCKIKETLASLYELFKFKLNSSIDFQLKFEDTIPSSIMIDERRYKQIVLNLLSNSSKFTTKGAIQINISYKIPFLLTSVVDTGLGIAESDKSKIFKQFSMIESAIHSNQSGSGLGLNLCKNLTELMGGQIGFKSVPNVRTEFYFTIKAENTIESQTRNNSLYSVSNSTIILAVDDNSMNLYLFQCFAKSKGIKFVSYQDPVEALKDIKKIDGKDLLGFIDINMPRMNGYEFAMECRKMHPKSVIIAVTGEDKQRIWDQCIASGFNDVIEKPISFEIFSRLLDQKESN